MRGWRLRQPSIRVVIEPPAAEPEPVTEAESEPGPDRPIRASVDVDVVLDVPGPLLADLGRGDLVGAGGAAAAVEPGDGHRVLVDLGSRGILVVILRVPAHPARVREPALAVGRGGRTVVRPI